MTQTSEKILKIENVYDYSELENWDKYDGYKVTTDKQEILVLISNGQSCCEDYGYFSSNDNLEYFVDAQLTSIETVDSALNVKKFNKAHEYGFGSGGVIFVNFNTSKGTFQLAVYNSHNGYYGHSVEIISKQLKLSDSL